MRKKEVRWISRDNDGSHFIWLNEPRKSRGAWWGALVGESPLELEACEFADGLEILITCGGLAKITIERQY